jgi:oligopeptidase A
VSTDDAATANPLLRPTPLPRFDEIRPEHVEPAMSALLAELTCELERLEAGVKPTWEALVEPLERIGDRMELVWGPVGHLMAVKNSPELRKAYEAVQPSIIAFFTRMGQSRPIYDALCALRDSPQWKTLDPARHRVVDNLIRDAKLSGVGLDGEAKDRFNAIELELAELGTRFSNNVLDATKAFALTLTRKDEVDGLPPSLLALSAQAAREAATQEQREPTAEEGPWRITLDQPSLVPFLEHSRRRDLRETLYRAYITRASDGDLDNAPLIDRILALRHEQAGLLGFSSYAEMSLASKMAPSVDEVESLLEELRTASFDPAVHDLDEVRALAASEGAPEASDVAHWDVAFWAERLRERRYALHEEELRPYFPLPRVLDGLFGLASKLFGIRIEAADGEATLWHPDVRFFRVRDESGQPLASFYLDPYSRPAEKRGGAWMGDCVGRAREHDGGRSTLRLPVAYVVCNQTTPVGGRPSLMSFTELRTLFHEFGHGLQHMLTRVDHPFVAGIRGVEWDAVELPSQFMENWCYHRDTLVGLSGHVDSGEPLPDELFNRIVAARNYRAGTLMLRQLYFGMIDMELHHRWRPGRGESAFDVQRRVARTTTVMPPLAEDRFLCSFGHVFAGGYAAGYYSYKWAEVLSADAFSAFEEAGLDDATALAETGHRFRDTVLALGGSRAPMDVFVSFRGREPSTEALLRQSGLAAPAAA